MPTLSGHAWRYSATDGQDHLFPSGTESHEGALTAACGKKVMGFRVHAEERCRYCLDCLLELGKTQAHKIENARALALKWFRNGSA
ncbi:MAG: hypothetical protein ABIQ18_18035 [Umezawaea sp.]